MRFLILGAVFLWLASTFYLLLTWDFSPDSFLDWAAMVVFFGGIVLGLLGAIVALVTGIWSGHQEKKRWS
jgi:hypothetical protein